MPLRFPLRPQRVSLGPQIRQFPPQNFQPGLAGLVLFFGERGILDLQAHHPPGQLIKVGRHRIDLGTDHRARFVDEVDRLVRQESIGDITVTHGRRRDQRAVRDLHAVKYLQALPEAAQNRHRVLDRRLIHHDRLESAFERGVLLDLLPVLIQRGGADHVQLTTGQHRLEHVACIHGAFCGARPDHRMQFVDEQQDASGCGLDLGEHRLEAFLELAAVLSAGY